MKNNHSLFIKLYQFFDNNLLEDFNFFIETKRYKSQLEEVNCWRDEALKKVKFGEVENEEDWINNLTEKFNLASYDCHLDFEYDELINEICYQTNGDVLPELLRILVARNHFNFLTFLLEKELIDYQAKQILFIESIMDSYHYKDNIMKEFDLFYDKLVTKLLQDKNDLDYIFVGKYNALMKAATKGNLILIEKLLKYELNPATVNEDNLKALDYLNKFTKSSHHFLLNQNTNFELEIIKTKLKDMENIYYERKKFENILDKKIDEKDNNNNKKI
jgi:hypothetical protein